MSLVFKGINATNVEGAGFTTRKSVRLATTIAGTLSTNFANGQIIDGVILVTGYRILIKDQASGIENGIYVVAASGSPSRDSDYDSGESVGGTFVSVKQGTANADSIWLCTNDDGTDIVDTDALTYKRISSTIDGPTSSTDTAIAKFSGTTGSNLQNSAILIDASNNVTGLQYIQFSDVSAPSNPSDGQGRLYKKTGNAGLFWKPDSAGTELDVTAGSAGGEANTASNVGTGGVGVFKQKNGINLEFKNISVGDGVSVTDDTGNSNVLLAANVNGLTQDTAPDGTADYVMIYDASVGNHKKVLLNALPRRYYEVFASTATSTTSSTYVAMDSMTITPAAGTYIATFNAMINGSSQNNTYSIEFTVAGTAVPNSVRNYDFTAAQLTGSYMSICSQAIITANGSQAVDVRYQTTGGTFNVNGRSFILQRLA